MTAQVLLLRGINVGGHGKLPMADLRAHLLALGAGEARTYIQSGNAVVARSVDPEGLAERIEDAHGFRPDVFAVDAEIWRRRLANSPFPEMIAFPKSVHLSFAGDPTLPDLAPLKAIAGPSERVAATEGIVWLWAPDGIGRSKLAASMERLTGRSLTTRNGRTVAAITDLLGQIG